MVFHSNFGTKNIEGHKVSNELYITTFLIHPRIYRQIGDVDTNLGVQPLDLLSILPITGPIVARVPKKEGDRGGEPGGGRKDTSPNGAASL